MGLSRVLIIHRRSSDCSALTSVLSRERYDVVEASFDKGKIPIGAEECVILLDPPIASAGRGGLQAGQPQNGRLTFRWFPGQSGAARFIGGERRPPRRRARAALDTIDLGDRSIALGSRVVKSRAGQSRLTGLECAILNQLAAHVNRTVPSAELVRKLWPSDLSKGVHSLRAFIKNLRKKVEPDPAHPQYILTDLAVGYRLSLPAPRPEQ